MDAECPLPTRPLCVRTSCLPFLCRLTRILSLSLSLSLSVAENNSVELILYDIVARKEVQRLPHKAAVLTSLYVDHKGKKYIVVSTCDYVLTVWEPPSGPPPPPPPSPPPSSARLPPQLQTRMLCAQGLWTGEGRQMRKPFARASPSIGWPRGWSGCGLARET